MMDSLCETIKNTGLTYLNNRTFTALAVATSFLEKESYRNMCSYQGWIRHEKGALELTNSVYFDLASLTKPLVITLSILAMLKDGYIELDEKISSILSVDFPEDKRDFKVLHLLNHVSGLPAHRDFSVQLLKIDKEMRRTALISHILDQTPVESPSKRYLYSDLDYMLLGFCIEKRSGMSLTSYWKEKIIHPLGIGEHFFCYGQETEGNERKFVHTGKCGWSGKELAGLVNDDNCRAFGEMLGHAGLFGTLEGVFHLCKKIMRGIVGKGRHPSINNSDLLHFTDYERGGRWAYGFDIPTGTSPSCGSFFSPRTIGHLGFTGTSFWMDLEQERVIIVLTNRVIFGDDTEKIRVFRPLLHDIIMKEMSR